MFPDGFRLTLSALSIFMKRNNTSSSFSKNCKHEREARNEVHIHGPQVCIKDHGPCLYLTMVCLIELPEWKHIDECLEQMNGTFATQVCQLNGKASQVLNGLVNQLQLTPQLGLG